MEDKPHDETHDGDRGRSPANRRAATRPSAADQVEALNRLSWHHEILDQVMGQATLAVGAEKLWLATAIRLGATPARSAEDAHLKITYLEACADGWIFANARAGNHMLSAAMIVAAINVEKERWGHPANGGKPN